MKKESKQSQALKVLVDLVKLVDKKQKEKQRLEEKLSEVNEDLKRLTRSDLPDEMMANDLVEFVTDNGLKVTLRSDIEASISDDTRVEAMAWLRKNGFDGLIKNTVIVYFEKGQDKVKQAMGKSIEKYGLSAEEKEVVHPQTLKAFIREQMSKDGGKVPPEDVFHLSPFRFVKITKTS